MKGSTIILIIVIALIIAGVVYGKKVIDNFTFGNPKFVGADLGSIFGGTGFSTIDLSMSVDNKNTFAIPVKNLYAEVYYNGQLFGKSTNAHDPFTIPANGSITITQNMTFALTNTGAIIGKLYNKQPLQFTYMVKGTLFGFAPFKYNGNFTY